MESPATTPATATAPTIGKDPRDTTLLSALWRSKRFAWVTLWVSLCLFWAAKLSAKGALLYAVCALACAAFPLGMYLIGQSLIDAAARLNDNPDDDLSG